MITAQVTADITYLGVDDKQTELFEALWPIPQGISYNSYLIIDEKTALIDTVAQKFNQDFIQTLQNILGGRKLDYLILNHMEPDHSGTLTKIKKLYPEAIIVGNHKTAAFAHGFYQISKNQINQIETGDKISLGDHKLIFERTTMVHWPESMVVFEKNSGTLFSSDIFGGFKTVNGRPLAAQHPNLSEYINQARQYFAAVLGAHTRPTAKALDQLKSFPIKTIAPAHGLVWQNKKDQIFNLYKQWSQFESEPGIVIVYGSMYGFTKKTALLICQQLKKEQVEVKLLNAAHTSIAELLNYIWQYQGLVIASCTHNNHLFPPIKNLLDALETRRVKSKFLAVIGSYSWTGGALRYLKKFAQNSKLEIIEPQFKIQYQLDEQTRQQALALSENLIKRVKDQ